MSILTLSIMLICIINDNQSKEEMRNATELLPGVVISVPGSKNAVLC